MGSHMTHKAVRRKLKTLGVPLPAGHTIRRMRGNTFRVYAGNPAYVDNAVAQIRRAGYYAYVHHHTGYASTLWFNLAGTEDHDGTMQTWLFDGIEEA